MIFRQLFDPQSSTYTYLLADESSRHVVLVDPVFEQVRRDSALIDELGLRLDWTLETHVHADHVTGAWLLRERLGSKIALAAAGGAEGADRYLQPGDRVEFGKRFLEVRTPGHTNGCVTYVGEKVLSLKRDGCRIILLSGSLQVLVDELKDRLAAEILIGGDLEVAEGKLTGRKTGIYPYGEQKVDALYHRIDPGTVDWPNSWALADRMSDLPILELVGRPVAVHPDRRLRRLARKRGWETIG